MKKETERISIVKATKESNEKIKPDFFIFIN